jgi:hypothetical protein
VPARITFEAESHVVDHHSVQCTFALWKALCKVLEEGEWQPLPAGCHLIPEVVTTWNRGKDPINVYSRFQKKSKSAHSHLGAVGAIWLRLIMTCVYNAYHSFNLSKTAKYLMSKECKLFKDFQKRHSRQLPFRQFCQALASNLTVDIVPPSGYESSSSKDDRMMVDDNDGRVGTDRGEDDRQRTHQDTVVSTFYNKCEAYFSKPHLIARRMNGRVVHLPSLAQKQTSCIRCSRKDHSDPGQKHS